MCVWFQTANSGKSLPQTGTIVHPQKAFQLILIRRRQTGLLRHGNVVRWVPLKHSVPV